MKANKIVIILVVCIILVLMVGIFGLSWYKNSLKPVVANDTNQEELIKVEVEGLGVAGIASLLENNNVIKSATAMKIYCKLNDINVLQAGKYEFNNSESMPQIVAHIVNGEVAKDEIKITFIEGKNIRWIAKKISETTNNTEDDVYNLLADEDYIDSLIEKYWFLTDDIKNEDIYYPLEGYLLPDTYIFENKDVTVENIFNVILNYTDKFLSKYVEEFNNNELSIHEVMTLASIAELEGKSLEDRKEIVGVLFNRLNEGMSLGSDVTTYYAFKVDMGDRDLTVRELNTENPYNTRGPDMAGKIPVGPICSSSKEAIEATLHFKETDAFYFVADKNGKVYFTKNNDEHNDVIQELKNEGLWFVYE